MGARRRVVPICLAAMMVAAGAEPQEVSPPASDPAADALAPEAPVASETPAGPGEGATPVTLADAVALALESNFDVLAAADDLRSAQLGYSTEVAEFFPKLTPKFRDFGEVTQWGMELGQRLPWTGGSLEGAANWRTEPDLASPFARSSTLGLALRQPLLRGLGPNSAHYLLRNRRRARQGRERGLERARQAVAVAVTRAFYQVVEQRALLAVARQSGKRSETLQKASEARLAVGLVSKLDVFRAQLQAAQAQDAMLRAEASLADAIERFRFLLGRGPGDLLEPAAVSLPEELPNEVEPLEVLVPRALEHRLDLHETKDAVDDARRSFSLARQNLLPQLDLLVGMASRGLGTTYGGAWRASDRQLTFGIETSLPLERSSDRAERAQAEITLATRARSLRQRELEIEGEVRSAVRELEQIRKSVDLQKTAVTVAEQQHRLATLRYQRGLASNFDVVEAEESLVLARSALVSLLARYQVERVELLRILGTLDVDTEFTR